MSRADARAPKRLVHTQDGRTNLHVWRGGRSYERQKGPIYRREWNNLLFSVRPQPPTEHQLLYFDVRKPLPYPASTFDAVYAFHIVEHLTPGQADAFLREVHRVLKPSGIARLSTPDLEGVCRAYLDRLEDHDRSPTEVSRVRYEWSVLELLDQIVRVRTGGLMRAYIAQGRCDPAYARERFGDVFDDFHPTSPPRSVNGANSGIADSSPTSSGIIKRLFKRVGRAARLDGNGRWARAAPDFRNSGEVNKWLYDHLSLSIALTEAGFEQILRKTFDTSDIPEWERFDFDRSTHGDYPIEPSLYLEARKPDGAI